MSTQTHTAAPVRHGDGLTGAPRRLWTPVPGQRQLPLFPDEQFECRLCGHDAHVDSTPLPGDLCYACAEHAEVER